MSDAVVKLSDAINRILDELVVYKTQIGLERLQSLHEFLYIYFEGTSKSLQLKTFRDTDLRRIFEVYLRLTRLYRYIHKQGYSFQLAHQCPRDQNIFFVLKRTIAKDITTVSSIIRAMTKPDPVTDWLYTFKGIGNVTALMLISLLDVRRCRTVASLWKYCDLYPTPADGFRINHNSLLTTRLRHWLGLYVGYNNANLAGTTHPYSDIYKYRYDYEVERNELGYYQNLAAFMVKHKADPANPYMPFYLQGKLSPQQVRHRALKWTLKIFLSHFYQVSYMLKYPHLWSWSKLRIAQDNPKRIPPPNFNEQTFMVIKPHQDDLESQLDIL